MPPAQPGRIPEPPRVDDHRRPRQGHAEREQGDVLSNHGQHGQAGELIERDQPQHQCADDNQPEPYAQHDHAETPVPGHHLGTPRRHDGKPHKRQRPPETPRFHLFCCAEETRPVLSRGARLPGGAVVTIGLPQSSGRP